MGKHNAPESGPLGGKSGRGKPHPDGWTEKRIDVAPKPDKSGNKVGGGPAGAGASRDPDRG